MDDKFLVEFLASDICVIICVDLLSPCGICITNLPVATPEVSGEVDLDPLENVSADVLQEPLDAAQQEQICSAVTSLLDENSPTADSFCSHPHALVSLPSGSSPASYVKQYRIPFNLRPIVAEICSILVAKMASPQSIVFVLILVQSTICFLMIVFPFRWLKKCLNALLVLQFSLPLIWSILTINSLLCYFWLSKDFLPCFGPSIHVCWCSFWHQNADQYL